MNKIMEKWQALSCVIGVIAIAAILTVMPFRLWREEIGATSKQIVAGSTGKITDEIYASQMFVAQYDHLDGLSFYVDMEPKAKDAKFTLRLFDEKYQLLRTREHSTAERNKKTGKITVPLNYETEIGKIYYYTLACDKGTMSVKYENKETADFAYNGPCFVGNYSLGGYSLISEYHYGQPLRKTRSMLVMGILFALAMAIIVGLRLVAGKKPNLREKVTLQWGIQKICNPLIIIGTIVGVILAGPMYLFSYQYVDIAVFTVGFILIGIVLWGIVNRTYQAPSDDKILVFLKEKLPDWLQAFCFAMGMLACIHYMNGLYNVFHDIAYRELLVWITLAVIVTFSKKELLNIWNPIALAASGFYAYKYYHMHLAEMGNEYEEQVLKLTSYLIVLVTIVAVRTLVTLIRGIVVFIKNKLKEEKKTYTLPKFDVVGYLTIGYLLLTVIMGYGIIAHRNTRGWPIFLVVVFGCFAFEMLLWKNKEHLLQNVMNGILLNFYGCTIYCLFHRPYMSFRYTRYPHIFHTVTVTATYLSVIVAVALVKLLYKYNKENNWKACYFELANVGIVINYVLFTMSRTSLISMVMMGFVLWILMLQGDNIAQKMNKMLRFIGLIVIVTFMFFPIVFSAQRIMPSIVRQPDQYDEIEHFEEDVLVGGDIRSDSYITMDRFVEIFSNKMFGLPEDTFDLYQYRVGGYTDDQYRKMNGIDEVPDVSDKHGQDTDKKTDTDTDSKKDSTSTEDKSQKQNGEEKNNQDTDKDARNNLDLPNVEADYVVLPERYAGTKVTLPKTVLRYSYNSGDELGEGATEDYTNGRMDIFRQYFSELNSDGHESMGATMPNGEVLYHAHNIYLQFAYDHGIMMGGLFILWLGYAVLLSALYYKRNKEKNETSAMPLAACLVLMIGGIVEWIAHPCNPVGFVFLLVLPALTMQIKDRKSSHE